MRCKELGAELIVAVPPGATHDALREEASIRFVSVAGDATPSDVRRLAVAHATGDIVLLLDWSALEEDGWCDRIRRYEANARTGAASEIRRREHAAIDWAEFLAVRGVVPVGRASKPEPSRPALAPDAGNARSALTRWTEDLVSVDRVRPASP